MWTVCRFDDGVYRARPYNGDMQYFADSVFGLGTVIAIFKSQDRAQAYVAMLNGEE